MTIEQTTDHVAEALENLLEQFKGKPTLAKVLTTYVDQIQDLENTAFGVYFGRMLSNAEGEQLDGLGDIVGEPRDGKTDAEYRIAIAVRILINKSGATPEDVIAIVDAATEGAFEIKYREYDPAAFIIELVGPIDPVTFTAQTAALIAGYLRDGKPAGVLAHLVYYPEDAFRYDSGPGYDQGHYGGAS